MGKISDYAQALKSKLTDLFVVYQNNNSELETKSVTIEQIGDAICGEQVHSDLKTDNQTIIGGINELAKDKNVADEYDDTHTYNTGDVTIYDNTLYICNTNNTTGTFDPSKWTATTIDNIIGDLSQLTTSVTSSLVGAVNSLTTKAVTITPQTGYSVLRFSGGKTDKLVGFSAIIGGALTVSNWVQIGTVDTLPTDEIYTPFLNTTTGTYSGMVNITTSGNVRAYATAATDRCAFSISYKTA